MIFFCLQCCINTQFEFNRCWKHQRSSEIMVHIDTIAAAADLLGAHQWCKSLIPPHLKCALLAWNLVTVKVIWVQWSHYHVQKLSEMIWASCVILMEAAIRQWFNVVIKGSTCSATILKYVVFLKNGQLVIKMCLNNVHHTLTSPPVAWNSDWYKSGWIDPTFSM